MQTRTQEEIRAALQRAELYYTTHPRSPSAVGQPNITLRSGTWMVSLGQNLEDGIVGFGNTVESALRAFDVRYRNSLRPANEALGFSRAT